MEKSSHGGLSSDPADVPSGMFVRFAREPLNAARLGGGTGLSCPIALADGHRRFVGENSG